MSEIQVNKLSPQSGTTITLGDSGDTFTIPSGATITNSGTATGFGEANTPSFGVRLSSNQSVANQTVTKLALATEDWDTDSAWNTSNYNFTVPSGQAGKYYFTGHYRLLSTYGHDSTNYFYQAIIRLNNSTVAEERVYDFSATTKEAYVGVSKILNLAVGDVVDFHAYQNGGQQANRDIDSNSAMTWFQGFKVAS